MLWIPKRKVVPLKYGVNSLVEQNMYKKKKWYSRQTTEEVIKLQISQTITTVSVSFALFWTFWWANGPEDAMVGLGKEGRDLGNCRKMHFLVGITTGCYCCGRFSSWVHLWDVGGKPSASSLSPQTKSCRSSRKHKSITHFCADVICII